MNNEGHTIPTPIPGRHLATYLEEFGITKYRLAKLTGISQNTIGRIIAGKCKITVETALRFGAVFGTSGQFWLNLQMQYDEVIAMRKMSAELAQIERASAGIRAAVAA